MTELYGAQLRRIFDDLCDVAAKQTMPRFRSQTKVENKRPQDFDPVTEADKGAEEAIRQYLEANLPHHGIVGEEFGIKEGESLYQWVIDPIDGTRAFISGLPVWGTLIGLYYDGVPYAGAMDQPFTKERFYAGPETQEMGLKTTLQLAGGQPEVQCTSQTKKLNQATLMTTSPHLLENDQDRKYFDLEKQVQLFRYGGDCYAYSMIACGQVDLVVESGLNVYDIAALIPIIEGAGGMVTNWQGGDASQGGQILAAANHGLHQQAMELLND